MTLKKNKTTSIYLRLAVVSGEGGGVGAGVGATVGH